MKKAEIQVGCFYVAKVAGKLTTVRVDAIRENDGFGARKATTSYEVTNQRTGRRTTFRSAAKFRSVARKAQAASDAADAEANAALDAQATTMMNAILAQRTNR